MKSKIFNLTKQYTGDLKTNLKRIKLEDHSSFLMYLSIFVTVISLVWLFITYMIPANPAVSELDYVNVTGFYATKFSNNFNTYSTSLAPNGIALSVWIGLSFILYIVTAVSHSKMHKVKKATNSEKTKMSAPTIIRMSAFIFMLVLTLALFAFVLIPPITRDLATAYYNYYLIQTAIASNDLQQMKTVASALGININGIDSNGAMIAALNNYNPFADTDFTPWYNVVGQGVAERSNVWCTGIVVFGVGLGTYFLAIVVSLFVTKKATIEKDLSKETMKQMLNKYKENRKERQAIRKNKKELLEQENELLKNLYDMDSELAKHNQDNLTPMQKINQRELEEKIAKNNELKKQLEELNKQKVELKKEIAKHSKVRAALNKVQETNSRQAKAKKQEIAVPDKELEEIFKSLDID